MLYTNETLKLHETKKDWGTLYYFEMGERGRGRVPIVLPCSPEIQCIEKGFHQNLAVGQTKAGRPRINCVDDGKLYMLLSSEMRYTRKGNGDIFVQVIGDQPLPVKTLATGNGADGDAGYIGSWRCAILEVLEDCIIRVRYGGFNYGIPAGIFIVRGNSVYHCTQDDIEDCCDRVGIDLPEGFRYVDGEFKIISAMWSRIPKAE